MFLRQKGQHTVKMGYATLDMKAAIDCTLRFWNWDFGLAGSLNDIKYLGQKVRAVVVERC
jgi:hypothetical protein